MAVIRGSEPIPLERELELSRPITQEEHAKVRADHARIMRQELSKGWLYESDLPDTIRRVMDTTPDDVVGDSDFVYDVARNNRQKVLSVGSKMAEQLEIVQRNAIEHADLMSPKNLAHTMKLAKFTGTTVEYLNTYKEAKEKAQKAYELGLSQEKVQKIYQYAASNRWRTTTDMLLKQGAHMALTLDEMEALYDMEASVPKAAQYAIAGNRGNSAAIAYYNSTLHSLVTGQDETTHSGLLEAKARIEAASVYASNLPEVGSIEAYWIKPFAQTDLFLRNMTGRLAGGTGAFLLSGGLSRVAAGTLLGGPAGTAAALASGAVSAARIEMGQRIGGIMAIAPIMIGNYLYELDNLYDEDGKEVEMDRTVKLAVAFAAGMGEAGIEDMQMALIIGGALIPAGLKKKVAQLAVSATGLRAKSLLQKQLARAAKSRVSRIVADKLKRPVITGAFSFGKRLALQTGSEMAEEGLQGMLNLAATDAAVGWQRARGSDIEWTYSKPDDYLNRFMDDAGESLQSFLLLGVPAAIGHGLGTYRNGHNKLNKLNADAAILKSTYDNLDTRARKMESTGRADVVADHINRLARDGAMGASGAFIDAARFSEILTEAVPLEGERNELLYSMGILPDEIDVGVSSGGTINVDIGSIITLAKSNPELSEAIRNEMRATPNGYTYAETEKRVKEYDEVDRRVTRTLEVANARLLEPRENLAYIPSSVIAPLVSAETIGEIAAQFGQTGEALGLAIERGADIPFDVSKVVSSVNLTPELIGAVARSASTTPGGEAVASILNSIVTEKADVVVLSRASQLMTIHDTIRGRMELAKMAPGNADEAATVMSSFIDRRAEYEGITPQEYFESFGNIQFHYGLDKKTGKGKIYMQSAYHGSRAKFDKFDTAFIGTGEGSQVEGWGAYVTVDKGNAEGYRRNVTSIANLERGIANAEASGYPEDADILRAELEATNKGQLYRVTIPGDNETMYLNLNARLDRQGRDVQKVLQKLLGADYDEQDTGMTAYFDLAARLGSPEAASKALYAEGVSGNVYVGKVEYTTPEPVNYVMFNPDDVQIEEAFYQGAAPGASKTYDRGRIVFRYTSEPGIENIQISFSPTADHSTVIHEMGHFFIRDVDKQIERLDRAGIDTSELSADREKLRAWVGWEEGQLDWAEAQHEKLADSMVMYLKTGKAPSSELTSVFRRYKDWLKDFYSSYFENGMELSDDVRQVFDRLLAVESEADKLLEAHGISRNASFKGLERLTATEGSKQAFDSVAASAERILAKTLEEMGALETDSKAFVQEYGEMLARVKESRPYKALEAFKKDKTLRMSRDAIREIIGADGLKEIPRALIAKGGTMKPDVVAFAMGYNDGFEMLTNMRNLPSPEAEARARTIQELNASDTGDSMEQRLEDGILNKQYYGGALTLIEDAIRETDGSTKREAKLRVNALADNLQSAAGEYVAGLDTGGLAKKIESVIAAEAKARGEYDVYWRQKKFERAARKGYHIALNIALLRELKAARKQVIVAQKRISRAMSVVTGPREKWGMHEEHIQAIENIMQDFGNLKEEKRRTARTMDLRGYVESNGLTDAIDEWLYSGGMNVNPRSIEAVISIGEAVERIRKYGKDETKGNSFAYKQGLRGSIKEVITSIRRNYDIDITLFDRLEEEELLESLTPAERKLRRESVRIGVGEQTEGSFSRTKWQNIKSGAKKFLYSNLRLENMTNVLDGRDNLYGSAFYNIYQPLRDGVNERSKLQREFMTEHRNIYKTLLDSDAKEREWRTKREFYRGLITEPRAGFAAHNGHLTRAELFGLFMNTGTTSNLQRLMATTGYSLEQVHILRSLLTESEHEAAAAMWRLLAKLGKIADEHYRDMHGYGMKMESPVSSIAVASDTGRTIRIEGGYYPISYDPNSNVSSAFGLKLAAGALPENSGGINYKGLPRRQPGYTKSRVTTSQYALRVDLSVVPRHIADVTHEVALRRRVKSVYDLMSHAVTHDAITTVMSEEGYTEMMNIIKDTWVRTEHMGGQLEQYIRSLSGTAAWASLAYNPSSALSQLKSLPTAMGHIPPRYIMQSIAKWNHLRGYEYATWKSEILEMSALLADRRDNKDLAINAAMRGNATLRHGGDKWGAFYMMRYMDEATSLIIWDAGFNEAVNKGLEKEEAIIRADALVRRAQDMADTLDVSRIQRSTLGGLLTTFQSANIAIFNSIWESTFWFQQHNVSKGQAFGGFMARLFRLMVFPAICNALLRGRTPEGEDGEDTEWTDYALWFGRESIGGVLESVPLVSAIDWKRKQVAPIAFKGITAAFEAGDAIRKLGLEVYNEGMEYAWQDLDGSSFLQKMVSGVGYTTGRLPAIELNRIIRVVDDMMESGIKPYSIFDAAYANRYMKGARREYE